MIISPLSGALSAQVKGCVSLSLGCKLLIFSHLNEER